jgi:hypothetical protein
MGIGNFFKKVGRTITGTANTVGNTVTDTANTVGNAVVEGANVAWDGTQKAAVCVTAINSVRENVQGHDPRTWMMDCAQQTIFKGQGSDYFKGCLLNKIKTEIQDIQDPQGYVESLWSEVQGGCS